MKEVKIVDLNSQINIKLRERFCKDTNIPIKMFIEPYFSSRLELFNPMYGAKDKYESFMKEIEGFNNPQDYFEFYNSVKDNAINFIKSVAAFDEFNNCDMNKYAIKDENLKNIRRKDIFHKENDGKAFISIDLAKANFTALRWINDSIVDGKDSYEEFIKQFCGDGFEHIIKSKYIRQVIFGNCNPSRQSAVEKYIMYNLLKDAVLKHFNYSDIACFPTDEIILRLDKENSSNYIEFYNTLMAVTEREGIKVNIEVFSLHNIENTVSYYKKFNEDFSGKSTIELKCVDAELMPFILREINGEEVTDEDMVIMHNNSLAKLLEIPKIKL